MTAVGFTGTRNELPTTQHDALANVLADINADNTTWTFHMGCCTGGDEAAATIARNLGMRVHGWPPINRTHRVPLNRLDINHTPMTYGQRNLAIVQHADILVACPAGSEQDHPRSGTWMTVRMARKLGIPRVIIYPDGGISTDAR